MKIKNKLLVTFIIMIMCISYIYTEAFAMPKEQKDNIYIISEFLISELDLNPNVAFGILGNIYQESKCNPAAKNQIGASGICQWMGGRKTNMIKQCKSDWKKDLDGQLEHLKNELTGPHKDVYLKLKSLSNNKKGMEQSAEIFCKEFEICGNYNIEVPKRIKHADKLRKEYHEKLGLKNSIECNFPIR